MHLNSMIKIFKERMHFEYCKKIINQDILDSELAGNIIINMKVRTDKI